MLLELLVSFSDLNVGLTHSAGEFVDTGQASLLTEYATDCGFGSFVELSPNNCSYCPGGTYSALTFGLNCTVCAPGYHNFWAGLSILELELHIIVFFEFLRRCDGFMISISISATMRSFVIISFFLTIAKAFMNTPFFALTTFLMNISLLRVLYHFFQVPRLAWRASLAATPTPPTP